MSRPDATEPGEDVGAAQPEHVRVPDPQGSAPRRPTPRHAAGRRPGAPQTTEYQRGVHGQGLLSRALWVRERNLKPEHFQNFSNQNSNNDCFFIPKKV